MGAGNLLVLLLAGVATCHHEVHHGWKHGIKYQYEMRGRNVAGLHQVGNQFVGYLTRGVVNIQPRSNGRINVMVEQPEQLDVHEHLARGWKTFVPDEGSQYSPWHLTARSFDLEFKGGVVNKMWVPREAPVHEVNILKAIASLLQADTTGVNLKKSSINGISEEKDFATFKTMETSVHGEVETTYNLSPLPEYHLQARPSLAPLANKCSDYGDLVQINKVLNFSKGHHLPLYHFGLSENLMVGSNMENILSRSTNSRAVVCGSLQNFLLQSSVTTDKVLVAPHLYNDEKGIVASEFNLTLVNAAESPQQPPTLSSDSNELLNLQYQYNPAKYSGEEETRSRRNKRSIVLGQKKSKKPQTSEENKSMQEEEDKDKHNVAKAPAGDRQTKNKNAIGHKIEKTKHNHASSSSYSDSSSSFSYSSEEKYWLPRPMLKSGLSTPFLPFFVSIDRSEQGSSKFSSWEAAGKLVQSIAHDLNQVDSMSQQQTLSKFTTLVTILQTMNETQLHHAADRFYVNYPHMSQSNKEDAVKYTSWVVVRDAVAQAATGPALILLKNWIGTSKVKGEEAAELVATIAKMAPYPTEEFVEVFYEMMTSQEVAKQSLLNSSAIISFSDLVRKVYVANQTIVHNYPVQTFGLPRSTKSKIATEKYLPHLRTAMEAAIGSGDSTLIQLYIWALGQTAHLDALDIFQPYLEGSKRVSDFQRLTMIASLYDMAKIYPKSVRPLVFRVYQNTGEKPEIRIAAIMQLMRTNPPSQLLQRIAQFTNYETSKQVNSAVVSAIMSAANNVEDSRDEELKNNARAAADLLTKYQYGQQYSKISFSSWEKKNLWLAYFHEMTHIKSDDSVMPSSYFCSMERRLGGFHNPNSKLFASTSSISNLMTLLSAHLSHESDDTQNREGPSKSPWNYHDITQKLNLHLPFEDQVEGHVMTTLMGSNRMFTFDNHTISQWPHYVKDAVEGIRHPKPFNMTKMYDQLNVKIAFPTAMGLPFSFVFSVPTVVSMTGQIQGKLHPDPARHEGPKTPFPKTINVTGDIDLLYSAMSEGKMTIVAPFNKKEYSAGLRRQMHIRLPLTYDFDIDLENTKVWWHSGLLRPQAVTKMVEYNAVPYTEIRNIFDFSTPSDIQIIQVRSPKKADIPVKMFGMSFNVKVDSQQESLTASYLYEAVRNHDFITALVYPLAEEAIHFNNFTVVYDGAKSSTAELRGVIKYNIRSNSGMETVLPTPKPVPNHKSHSQMSNPSERLDFNTEFDSHDREVEMLRRVAEGVTDAKSRILDISVETKEATQPKLWVASFGLGSSPISNVSKIIAFSSYGEKANPNHYKYLVDLKVTSPLLRIFDFKKALEEETTMEINGTISFGEAKNMAHIDIGSYMMKTEERRQALLKKDMSNVCKQQMSEGYLIQPACRNVTGRAGFIDSYSVDIKYDEKVPKLARRLAYIAYTIGRYYITDYMSEQISGEEAPEGRVTAKWNISPNEKTINIHLKSPAIEANFTDVPLDPAVGRPLIVIHPTYSVVSRLSSKFTRNQYFPICAIEGSKVNTFDNATLSANIGSCWYVMTHSAPKALQGIDTQGLNYSVLIRKTSAQTKEVMMVFDNNVIQLQWNSNAPEMLWNGKKAMLTQNRVSQFWDDKKETIAIVHLHPGNLTIVEAPRYKMQLLYDGARVIVQLYNDCRGKVRGLCGNFNGEKIDDLLSPAGCIHKNPSRFASEYALKDKTCSAPVVHNHQSNDECVFI